MTLTTEQQKLVEENIGLVGKVIGDKVHDVNRLGIYTYDDVFQIGCIGLCKAAATDKGGCFSTYAYRLIWNEICDALIYASRRMKTELPCVNVELLDTSDAEVHAASSIELQSVFESAKKQANPSTRKGIITLELQANGYTCKEIGKRMNAAPNIVTAWASKARKYLRQIPELRQCVK